MNWIIYLLATIGAIVVAFVLFAIIHNKYQDYMARKKQNKPVNPHPEEPEVTTQGNPEGDPPPTTYPDGTPIKPKPGDSN